METLLDRPGADSTAVFASTDLMAVGAMSALWRHGLRVPQDVSVVGCDNIRISEFLPVPLTTVLQPARWEPLPFVWRSNSTRISAFSRPSW
jgi:DNA-binding LacI/PurR family transcriptional regulator